MRFIGIGALVVCANTAIAETSNQFICSELEVPKWALLCKCSQIEDNDVQRLQCFDEAMADIEFGKMLSQSLALRLSEEPGGIDAMRDALERYDTKSD